MLRLVGIFTWASRSRRIFLSTFFRAYYIWIQSSSESFLELYLAPLTRISTKAFDSPLFLIVSFAKFIVWGRDNLYESALATFSSRIYSNCLYDSLGKSLLLGLPKKVARYWVRNEIETSSYLWTAVSTTVLFNFEKSLALYETSGLRCAYDLKRMSTSFSSNSCSFSSRLAHNLL